MPQKLHVTSLYDFNFKHMCFRNFLSFFLLLTLTGTVFAQQVPLHILGDKVPVYSGPSFEAPVDRYLNWDTQPLGNWEDDWYVIINADGETGYVSKWDAIEQSQVAEPFYAKRITPSAETLFRMMKFFKKSDKPARAEEFAIRIINEFGYEEYPTKDGCFKLAHLSYIYMISQPDEGVVYDEYLGAFTARVLDEAQMPTVRAMAHFHLARYFVLTGDAERAMNQLFSIIQKYPDAEAPNQCFPEKTDTWFYLPQRSKQLFLAIAMIQPEAKLGALRTRLTEMAERPENESHSQSFAQELLDNLGTMPYQRDNSIWY